MPRLFIKGSVSRITLFITLSAAILVGLALAKVTDVVLHEAWLIIAVLLIILSFRRQRIALLFLLVAGLLVGGWRGGEVANELVKYEPFVGAKVTLSGTITDDPEYGKRGERQFYVNNVVINGQKLPGKVRASSFSPVNIKRGDVISIEGKLREGFGNYQAGLSFGEIRSVQQKPSIINDLRDKFAAGVRNAVPEPQASLGLGLVVGQRSALPSDLDDAMRAVGLTHIVVASGYNLTILVRMARRLLARYSKYQATATAIFLMASFVAVTGFSPSMTRAALVTSLALWAWYYGRAFHPVLIILFSAALTGLINPIFVWSDIGWYLSFLAFAGVLIIAPLVQQKLFGTNQPKLVVQVCIETIAAQLATFPLILWIFGDFSWVAVIANVLVVPLIPFAMLATFIAGVAGMLVPAIAGWFGIVASGLMGAMLETVRWLAAPTWVLAKLKIHGVIMVTLYGCLAGVIFIAWRASKFNWRRHNLVE